MPDYFPDEPNYLESQTDTISCSSKRKAVPEVRISTETELREIFEHYGAVQNINLVHDQYTGKPRGFAFIEMTDNAEGTAAITAINGSQLGGRALVVNEARPRPSALRAAEVKNAHAAVSAAAAGTNSLITAPTASMAGTGVIEGSPTPEEKMMTYEDI